MIVARTIAHLQRAKADLRAAGPVVLVPTMGALHEGHVALFRRAREASAAVVASAFVNPTQFHDAGDLAAYPRREAEDEAIATDAGVRVLFVPSASEMYPEGHATSFTIAGAALGFEGASRPGHFDGVALVCLKLFHLVEPRVAIFGQKDAQQVAVIRQLVRDTDLDLEIVVVPTVRERSGLALSSRNARLSPDERLRAQVIPRALRAGLAAYHRGADPIGAARAALGSLEVDYVDVAPFDGDPTLVLAVRVGAVRLIDNVPLERPAAAGL